VTFINCGKNQNTNEKKQFIILSIASSDFFTAHDIAIKIIKLIVSSMALSFGGSCGIELKFKPHPIPSKIHFQAACRIQFGLGLLLEHVVMHQCKHSLLKYRVDIRLQAERL
jgi:hypothetical protein